MIKRLIPWNIVIGLIAGAVIVLFLALIMNSNIAKPGEDYYYGQEFTDEEKAKVIALALQNDTVRQSIGDQPYEIDGVSTGRINQPVQGETPLPGQVSGVYPFVDILIGNLSLPGTKLQVVVDYKKDRVVYVGEFPRKPDIVYPVPQI